LRLIPQLELPLIDRVSFFFAEYIYGGVIKPLGSSYSGITVMSFLSYSFFNSILLFFWPVGAGIFLMIELVSFWSLGLEEDASPGSSLKNYRSADSVFSVILSLSTSAIGFKFYSSDLPSTCEDIVSMGKDAVLRSKGFKLKGRVSTGYSFYYY
jgi:hypothetical protein